MGLLSTPNGAQDYTSSGGTAMETVFEDNEGPGVEMNVDSTEDSSEDSEDSEDENGLEKHSEDDRWAFLFSDLQLELADGLNRGDRRGYTDEELLDPLADDEDFLPHVPGSAQASSAAEAVDLANDPLFQSRSHLISSEEDSEEREEDDGVLPPAFDEPAAIRNVYIRVFIGAAFDGITHKSVAKTLLSHKLALSAVASPDLRLAIGKMALTLRTVERRLGVSPDQHITFYFVCPECFAVHHPSKLQKLPSPTCANRGCEGILYTTPDPQDGYPPLGADDLEAELSTAKRTPTKIMPYASLQGYVRRLLRRPGKLEEINHWRKHYPEDLIPFTEPIPEGEWTRRMGTQQPLRDIFDGAAWRAATAGLERRMDEEHRRAYDSNTLPQPIRFVSLPYPLMFQFNIDW